MNSFTAGPAFNRIENPICPNCGEAIEIPADIATPEWKALLKDVYRRPQDYCMVCRHTEFERANKARTTGIP